MKEIVKINFPVEIRECALREVRARQFTAAPLAQEFIVCMKRQIARRLLLSEQIHGLFHVVTAALLVGRRLVPESLWEKVAGVNH
jgi:hypothetical protein